MTGAERIAAERQRQIDVEGYDADHDYDHHEELARAAACYALPHDWLKYKDEAESKNATVVVQVALWAHLWPWDEQYWKPTDSRVRDLEKAGALIAAAIDSLLAGVSPMTSDPTPDRHREAREAAHTHATLVQEHEHRGYPPHEHRWLTLEDARTMFVPLSPAGPEEPQEGLTDVLHQALLNASWPGGVMTGFTRQAAEAVARELERLATAMYADGCITPPRTDHAAHVLAALATTPAPDTGAEDPSAEELAANDLRVNAAHLARAEMFERGRLTGQVEGWADYTETRHDDEYDALARQFHESINEGQSVADTAKALRILAVPDTGTEERLRAALDDPFDDAWAEVQDMLPEGWVLHLVDYGEPSPYNPPPDQQFGQPRYEASAKLGILSSRPKHVGRGFTPAGALRELLRVLSGGSVDEERDSDES